MDKDILGRFLLELDSFSKTIQSVSQYCCQYDKQASEITDVFIQYFTKARKDKKIYFFYSIHEIFMESQRKQSSYFIKSFGAKLKDIVRQICESTEVFDTIKKVVQIVERWKSDKIFHPEFCEKLKSIVGPYYKDLKEQYQKYYGEKDKEGKYTKTFLVNYQIVNEDQLCSDIYKVFSDSEYMIQAIDKHSKICDQFLKRCPNSQSVRDEKDKESLDQIISQGKEYIENMIQKIDTLQKVYVQVGDSSQREVNDYMNFSVEDIQNWQQKFKELIDNN
ncbi:hypothetical protein ABPG74_005128 [Tetrahymena malaccensis]